jgi:hypothetical protein
MTRWARRRVRDISLRELRDDKMGAAPVGILRCAKFRHDKMGSAPVGIFRCAKFRDDKMGSAPVGIFRWREIPG